MNGSLESHWEAFSIDNRYLKDIGLQKVLKLILHYLFILKILKFLNSDSKFEAKIFLEAFFFVQRRAENNLP